VSLPDSFDLDRLLAAIPGAAPQGTDMREDYSTRSPYSRMRDTRSEARDAEKQLELFDSASNTPPPEPAPLWRALREIGVQLLTEQTKDLEIASWVTEALVRSHGLAGLAVGSRLIAGLIERYWNNIYPLPDEYGMETRVAPIMALNGRSGSGTLMAPLIRTVLFNRADGTPVALHQYQASARLMSLDALARQQRLQAGTIPFEEIEKDARTVGRANLVKLRDKAAEAAAAWEAMAALVDEKAGSDAPMTSHVRDLLHEMRVIAALYVPQAAEASLEEDSKTSATSIEATAEGGGVVVAQGMTRESALRSLETLAAFFRRTEPQSPLSYTLDEAVRRARMPWLELLDEVIADRSSRDAFLTTLGIRPPAPPE
jgi:type VI secretion system protein ImpA